ncbi:MAG: hypothetical protein MUE37_05280 [Bacteroidales bacterium]|nr:hypothetical protein [Bacteroidales bacterium]
MKNRIQRKFLLSVLTGIIVILLLLPLQFTGGKPMFLLERIFNGGGYLQIFIIALFAAVMEYNMLTPERTGWWRRFNWSLFSGVFFMQLILGIAVDNIRSHLPGGELSVMTLIFLSAVVFSGRAWCSQYCCFGAIDSASAGRNGRSASIRHFLALKNSFLILAIAVALLLSISRADRETALIAGIVTGSLSACRHSSITCRFPGLKAETARYSYITVTIVPYSIVPAMARI